MKIKYFIILISLISLKAFSQENAYSSFDASLKNSIKFNRFLINPAFSFAREASPTITLVNRRQWTKFENAPQLYFANYLGSINYNSRFGLGVYQQKVGLLKNFGGVINYTYNISVGLESNLSFGLNTYIYNSTFDFGNIITVETEPLLLNKKANSLIALKPGLNFGTEMFDFGISVNNLVLYNLTTSEMVADNQENSYLGHLMYTGYVNSYRGILEDAKFSSLFTIEKTKDATALAGNLLLDIPNKAWINAGYNTLYGFSAGVGLTLSEKFSLGYTYDLGLGDVSQLGASHDFLLSYRFEDYEESNRYYQTVSNKSTKKSKTSTPKKSKEQIAQEKADQLASAKAERDRKAAEAAEKAKQNKLALEEAARKRAEAAKAKKESIQPKKPIVKIPIKTEKDKLAAEEAARKLAAEKAKAEADAKAEQERLAAEAAKKQADAKSQAEKDKLAAEETARKLAAEKAKAEADAKAEKDRLAAEEAARKLAAEKAKAEADAKAEQERLAAEAAKKQADAKSQAEKDRLAAEEAARKLAAEKAKAEADAKALKDKLAAEKAKAEADAKAEKDRLVAEEAARKLAAEKAKAEADAKAEQERLAAEAAKKQADAKSQAEKDKLAAEEAARKLAAEKAKAEADAKAEKDRLAAEEAARKLAAEKAKAEADAKAEKDRLAAEAAARKLAAEKAKAEADAKAEKDKLAAEETARKLAAEKAKAEADAKAEKDRLAAEEAARKLAAEKAKAEADAKNKLLNDESNKAVEAFKKDIELKTKVSDKLTKSLDSIVQARDLDLKEYLLENTLNSDGTERAPRKFVSVAEQNAQLQSLKSKISNNKVEFDKLIKDFETTNNQRIKDLKAKGISDEDAKPLNDSYLKILNDLKQKRITFNKLEIEADLKIQKIKEEKDAERQRRIKKADFDTEKDRNLRDQQILENLKKNQNLDNSNTSVNENKTNDQAITNTVTDIPIIKKLVDVESGYYLVLATFSSIEQMQAYLPTVLKAGGSSVNFFYNLHNSTYYVYTNREDSMSEANKLLKVKGTKTYNKNMFIVKVE